MTRPEGFTNEKAAIVWRNRLLPGFSPFLIESAVPAAEPGPPKDVPTEANANPEIEQGHDVADFGEARYLAATLNQFRNQIFTGCRLDTTKSMTLEFDSGDRLSGASISGW